METREVRQEAAVTKDWQNPNDDDYDEKLAFQITAYRVSKQLLKSDEGLLFDANLTNFAGILPRHAAFLLS